MAVLTDHSPRPAALDQNASFQEANHKPERASEVDSLVERVRSALKPGQILVYGTAFLVDPESKRTRLSNGIELPSDLVINTMIRLELMSVISRDSFEALMAHAHNPSSRLSDWHKINSETYGFGVTRDSKSFAAERVASRRRAFFDGMRNPLGRFAARAMDFREKERLDFEFLPDRRAICVAATIRSGGGWALKSPEI